MISQQVAVVTCAILLSVDMNDITPLLYCNYNKVHHSVLKQAIRYRKCTAIQSASQYAVQSVELTAVLNVSQYRVHCCTERMVETIDHASCMTLCTLQLSVIFPAQGDISLSASLFSWVSEALRCSS